MAEDRQIHVELGNRSYKIAVGAGGLDRFADYCQRVAPAAHYVVISDANTQKLYGDAVAASLKQFARVDAFVVPAGEASKSISQIDQLWQQMLAAPTDRKSVVIAVGGGVVGDLAGFAAAGYARGVSFIQVPTTLLAQVDSSVGGKTGINLPGAKNMVGAFWQPTGVLIDVNTLNTLPDRELSAGLAEVVKYGVIMDENFFRYVEENTAAIMAKDSETLATVVARSCRLKADVVEADEHETTGRRAILNYGHTFGHALEAVLGYGSLLHGEAVSIGMVAAAKLAEKLGRIDGELVERQSRLLTALNLPIAWPDVDADACIAAMGKDKKVAAGKLRFILPSKLGHVELVSDVDWELVKSVM